MVYSIWYMVSFTAPSKGVFGMEGDRYIYIYIYINTYRVYGIWYSLGLL